MARSRSVNVRDLRRSNRSRTLVEMYLSGPMTRQEVGSAVGVSPATVSNVVGELIAQGVLMEVGVEESDGGRPRALLQINGAFANVVGVDVGETAVLVELFDLNMHVLASHTSRPTSALAAEEAVAHVLDGLAHVIAESGIAEDTILGVGVGVPGLVQHGEDGFVHAQTVGWDAVPFGKMLRRGTSLPLQVDNGANTLGQAEKWFGAARSVDNAVIVLLGTGLGTSIIIDGELYRGPSSSAGEGGHLSVEVNGRLCRCGASGCLEAYVGANAVIERYDALRRGSSDALDPVAKIEAIAAAGPGDRSAVRVIDETAMYLGAGIADFVNLFNPERIVVGGWMGNILGAKLLPGIREYASRGALRLPFSQVSIVAAELGTDAVALGAATLPISSFLARGAVPVTRKPLPRQRRPALARRDGTRTK
ncbi:MAG: ROK family transcriptional regulator [Actinomycetota bacterium]